MQKAEFCSKHVSHNIILKYEYVFDIYNFTQGLLPHFLWMEKKIIAAYIVTSKI